MSQPVNNPTDGAPPPEPPNPADIMAQLVQAMTTLADVSTMSLANNLSKVKVVQKPSPFKGEQGSDARRFLGAYEMWATAQGTALNVVDRQGAEVGPREGEWIHAALSFLQDDAAIWASPAMEEFARGVAPFGGEWAVFRREFKARFETVDEAVDAKEKLRVLWQRNSTVPEYAALFKELMSRTGYSSVDLRDRFYDHLHPRIKNELVHTARPIDTLNGLITVASDIDIRLCQRQAEREREERRPGASTGTAAMRPSFPTTSFTPFVPPSAEPTAMDVDATRTRDEFLRQMRGRCFGCGSTVHSKRDGNHDRDLCGYCKKVGHRETVCMDKFLKRAKGQKAAATAEERLEIELADDGIDETEESDQETLAATTANTLAELKEQQRVLAEKISALEADF